VKQTNFKELDSLSTILFDFDDTLLNSFEARIKALQGVFKAAGIHRPGAAQFMRNLRGSQLKDALAQFEMTRIVETNLFEDYRRAYWTKEPGAISLYPGVKPVLDFLHSHGIMLGVVTQKGRIFEIEGRGVGALEELKELGIANLFSVIVGFDDVKKTKPHPEGINLALKHLEASPRETLVVGDSAADIEAAQSAGCWSCHATWGIPVAEHGLDSIKADLVANRPEVLLSLSFKPRQ